MKLTQVHHNDITQLHEAHGASLTDAILATIPDTCWDNLFQHGEQPTNTSEWRWMVSDMQDSLILDPTRVPAYMYSEGFVTAMVQWVSNDTGHDYFYFLLISQIHRIYGIPLDSFGLNQDISNNLIDLIGKELFMGGSVSGMKLNLLNRKLNAIKAYLDLFGDKLSLPSFSLETIVDGIEHVLATTKTGHSSHLHHLVEIAVLAGNIWPEIFTSTILLNMMGLTAEELISQLSHPGQLRSAIHIGANIKLLLGDIPQVFVNNNSLNPILQLS